MKRVMIAAARSGSGKTVITLALLKLLSDMDMDVTSYKCGPDYIDPMFHKRVLGISGGNLDTFFAGRDGVRDILLKCENEYAVIEGVMGIYDGLGGLSIEGSCYDIAKTTKTPVILVVDAYGSGRTLTSLIRGILDDDKTHLIKGVILNRISAAFFERLAPLLNDAMADYGAKVVGFLPKLSGLNIESRHLGLLRPGEIEGLSDMIGMLSRELEKNCDIKEICALMSEAKPIKKPDKTAKAMPNLIASDTQPMRLAVAYDEAFCFYYKENLDILKDFGAEPVFFSPIRDEKLPDDINGIYIGGGYPELYLRELSENKSMLSSVKEALSCGVPSIAECGGFMYLNDAIEDENGTAYPMAGAVSGVCRKGDHLKRFGYVTMRYHGKGAADTLAESLNGMRGHEFHYYDSTNNGRDITIVKAGDKREWMGVHIGKRYIWGFPHMYFPSAPSFVRRFTEVMRNG